MGIRQVIHHMNKEFLQNKIIKLAQNVMCGQWEFYYINYSLACIFFFILKKKFILFLIII